MPTEHKIPLTVSITLIGVITGVWAVASAFAGKADKSEIQSVREQYSELSAQRREDAVIQKNILSLLEKMDARMSRIEDKQDYTIKEIVRNRDSFQPPASTPSPNPLNR